MNPRTYRDNQVLQLFAIVTMVAYLLFSVVLHGILKFLEIAKIGDSWWQLQKFALFHISSIFSFPWQHQIRLLIPISIALSLAAWAAKKEWRKLDPDSVRHLEGREPIMDTEDAAQFLAREWADPGPGATPLAPGLPSMPRNKATEGGIIFGGTGSGKTVVVENLLQHLLAENAEGGKNRIIIHDVKGDFTSQIPPVVGENGKRRGQFALMAPWDERSAVHEIAADIATVSEARVFAANTIPESKNSPMFSSAARQLLTGFCVFLQSTKPGAWGYADLARLAVSPAGELLEIMKTHHKEAVKTVEDQNVTTTGILLNLISSFAPIFDLARAWPTPPEPEKGFSMRRWLAGEDKAKENILILQNDANFKPVAVALHSALLAVAAQTIASPRMTESGDRAIWFFLDEFPQFPQSAGDSVETIMAVGRSKGSRMWLMSQSVGQLNQVHGRDRVKGWLDMIGTTLIGKTSGAGARDFTEVVGQRTVERVEFSQSAGGSGSSSTNSFRRSTEPVIDSSKLAGLGPVAGQPAVDFLLPLADRFLLRIRFPFVVRKNYIPASVLAGWTREPNPFVGLDGMPKLTPADPAPADPTGEARAEKSTEAAKPKTETVIETTTTTEQVVVGTDADDLKLFDILPGADEASEKLAEAAGTEIAEQMLPGAGEVIHGIEAIAETIGDPATGAAINIRIAARQKLAQKMREVEEDENQQGESQ